MIVLMLDGYRIATFDTIDEAQDFTRAALANADAQCERGETVTIDGPDNHHGVGGHARFHPDVWPDRRRGFSLDGWNGGHRWMIRNFAPDRYSLIETAAGAPFRELHGA